MNYLAHHWLAGESEDIQFGVWLGDFVKGIHLEQYSPDVQLGIRLHRATDTWIDKQKLLLQMKASFPPDLRRFSGIVLDMMADHYLALNWRAYDSRSLAVAEQEAYHMLFERRAMLPEGLNMFMNYAFPRNLLQGYRKLDVIEQSLFGIGERMNRANPFTHIRPLLNDHYDELGTLFSYLLPGSQLYVRDWLFTARKETAKELEDDISDHRIMVGGA